SVRARGIPRQIPGRVARPRGGKNQGTGGGAARGRRAAQGHQPDGGAEAQPGAGAGRTCVEERGASGQTNPAARRRRPPPAGAAAAGVRRRQEERAGRSRTRSLFSLSAQEGFRLVSKAGDKFLSSFTTRLLCRCTPRNDGI